MSTKRQAHGMVLVKNHVYCCGGLDGSYEILKTCERFDLSSQLWCQDVPNLSIEKFSMTMMVMDQTWVYSFGGASPAFQEEPKGFEVERLDTSTLGGQNAKWERVIIKCDFVRGCQQGVIPLNTSWGDEQLGQPGERRFIVFGGVHHDFMKQTFMFNENMADFSKSYCSEKNIAIPFADKFYYQQMFRITELPKEILKHIEAQKDQESLQYSENMVVYTGRRGLHIFDVDRERWVFNSSQKGYNYQDHYYKARKIASTAHEEGGTGDSWSDEEEEEVDDDSFESALDELMENYAVEPEADESEEEQKQD